MFKNIKPKKQTSTINKTLQHADNLKYFEKKINILEEERKEIIKILSYHTSNDCTNKTCGARVRLGETVRTNCFLWRGDE